MCCWKVVGKYVLEERRSSAGGDGRYRFGGPATSHSASQLREQRHRNQRTADLQSGNKDGVEGVASRELRERARRRASERRPWKETNEERAWMIGPFWKAMADN